MGEENESTEGEAVPEADPMEELRAELSGSEARARELLDRLKYLQAEVENTRKQAERDRAEYVRHANALLVSRLLPILDQFDLALRSPEAQGEGFGAGVRMIRENLFAAFRAEGLEEIPVGEKFDPYLHEAVAQVEVDDEEEGSIIDVVQKGYRLGPRVLRPAQVVVARPAAGSGAAHQAPKDEGE
jgi:molecular chaperone GrpE